MKQVNIDYIRNFLEEVQALYEADDGTFIPEYIEDGVKNIHVILDEEEKELLKIF